MRPTAGNAALRPAQNRSRSASEFDTAACVVEPQHSRRSRDLLDQVVDLGLRAVQFDDQQRLDVERIAGVHELLGAWIAGLSIISMPPGMMPAPMMRATQAPASSRLAKPTSTARAVSGFFRMRTVTSVTTPSRPSEPVTTPSRS
jgi:hypothetical protein